MPDDSLDPPPWAGHGRIPCLDGLRALAISLVLLGHFLPTVGVVNLFTRLIGHIGVTAFFVISGFLITMLMLREQDAKGRLSLKAFYMRRTVRIIPPWLVFALIILSFQLAGKIHYPAYLWIAAFTHTICYIPHDNAWLISHFWSLAVEEHFYLIWPLVVAAAPRRFAFRAALIYFCSAPILNYALFRLNSPFLDREYCSLTQMTSIAIGCCVAFTVMDPALGKVWRALIQPGWILALIGLVVLALSVFGAHLTWKYGAVLADPVNALAFALILIGSVAQRSWLSRLLNLNPLVLLGTVSYSLYLWQQPFSGRPSLMYWRFPWNILAALTCAALSFLLIERPLMGVRKRLHYSGSGDSAFIEAASDRKRSEE